MTKTDDAQTDVFNFSGKVAVITGGASGIGLAVATALARHGAKLVLADIETKVLDEASRALADMGAEVIGVRTDVGDLASVQGLAERAWARFGAVHLLFNNAGVAPIGPTQQMSHEDWVWSLQVNLWGPIHGVEAFLPRMIEQGQGGHLLFTASYAGLVANRDLGPYNVAKAGVVSLAESLYKDLRGSGIGVSVLCPMRVLSNIDDSSRNRPAELSHTAYVRTAEQLEALHGRPLEADTVADLVLAAVRRKQLYIHTHKEAEASVRRRAERLAAAFDYAV